VSKATLFKIYSVSDCPSTGGFEIFKWPSAINIIINTDTTAFTINRRKNTAAILSVLKINSTYGTQ
jgi:hypothetical protein